MRSFISLTWLAIILFLSSSDLSAKVSKADAQNTSKRDAYIVTLKSEPVTTYKGGVRGIPATHAKTLGQNKFDSKTAASVDYRNYLKTQHSLVTQKATQLLQRKVVPKRQFFYALNGYAVDLTAAEAKKLRTLSDVNSVYKVPTYTLETDRGPSIIRAPEVWQGIFNSTQARGEGVIVGIVDTGINHDHPSFAEESSDGYVHTNPLGPNTYLGQCVSTPSLCNAKLIGSYNLLTGNTEPDDENGHGTHVASTAAGNLVQIGDGFELSGVAPRANIVSYKVGGADRSLDGVAITAAFDQAVEDGVDVLNFSAGTSEAYHPWQFGTLYLNIRQAGIVFVTSAGNSGPDNQTTGSPANYPWVTSVAATTHDRANFTTKQIGSFAGGTSTPPPSITGRSATGSYSAAIVYAGGFNNGDTNPEQCLSPFAPGTFNGEIVVCDRGSIARAEKAKNVAAGGAGGFVLANVDGGETSLADDVYLIPGIHISAADGNNLKSWLANGTGHTAAITAVGIVNGAADVVADFSSRGPNTPAESIITSNGSTIAGPIDVVVPHLAAPGANILAADFDPVDFGLKSGTSMASPHVAGAAAILVQLHPSWSPSAIHSALATTGITSLTTQAGAEANSFDVGGGRIDIPNALNAGLLLEESVSNFTAANPDSNGDPKTLNLPSALDSECVITCTWTRTVTAVEANTWNVQISAGAENNITVSPTSFSLAQGESQSVDITFSTAGTAGGNWFHGAVSFVPTGGTVGETRVPVVARSANSTFTGYFEMSNDTSSGSFQFSNIQSVAEANPLVSGSLTRALVATISVEQDSDNTSPYDDLSDGVEVRALMVNSGAEMLVVTTSNSTSNDIDLYIGLDSNRNGRPDEFEQLAVSAAAGSNEEIRIENPGAGSYWIIVQNWDANQPSDTVSLTTAVVTNTPSSNLSFNLPTTLDGANPFNIDMTWSELNPVNSVWYGAVYLGNAQDPDALGKALIKINRGATPDSTDGGNSGGDSSGSSGGGGVLIFSGLLVLLAVMRRRYPV